MNESHKQWGHDELADDLARHLRCESVMTWTNIQLGPSGSPRPDVYTLKKSFAHPDPRAYEVKVNESDFRSDVTSGKWRSYLSYAGSVTFAVPSGMVSVRDLPPLVGLIVRGDTGWRAARRATPAAISIPQDALMKLLIDGIDREGGRHRTRTYAEAMCGVDRFCEKFGADAAVWVRARENAENSVRSAEYAAQRIIDDAQRRASAIVESAVRDAPREWARLLSVLNMPTDASEWAVRGAITKLGEAARGGQHAGRLKSLRVALERAVSCANELADAMEPEQDSSCTTPPSAL